MSGRLMARVYEHQFTHGEQSVMLALADHADDDGRHVFPRIEYVAWKTDYSERQVQRIMHALTKRGALIVVLAAGRRRPTEYRINLDAVPVKPSFVAKGDTMSPHEPVRGDICDTRGDMVSPVGDSGVTSETLRGDICDTRGDIAMSPPVLTPKLTITQPSERERPRANGARAPNRPPPPRLVPIPVPFDPGEDFAAWMREMKFPREWVRRRIEAYINHYDGGTVRRTEEEWVSRCRKWLLDDWEKAQGAPAMRR